MSETPVKASCTLCARNMLFFPDTPQLKCAACGTTNFHPMPEKLGGGAQPDTKVPDALLQKAHSCRVDGSFDKAEQYYTNFITMNPTSPDVHEAHWGLAMCRFGVQFVEDPNSGDIMPTVHFTSPEAIREDFDYKEAVKYAPEETRQKYEEYGKYIDDVMNNIREIARSMDGFQIFLCYKHSDPDHPGKTTKDYNQVLTMYYELQARGYKVFLADKTLKEHVGANYEAMIYHALNTAKVMLLFCSNTRYIESPWVKSEWTRFQAMMKQDPANKHLLPLVYDMNPYDLPLAITNGNTEVLVMDAFGFNTLLTNLETIFKGDLPQIDGDLENARFSLLHSNWAAANAYLKDVQAKIQAEKQRSEYSTLHLYKLLSKLHVSAPEGLKELDVPFSDERDWQTAMEYADEAQREEYTSYLPVRAALVARAMANAKAALENKNWSGTGEPLMIVAHNIDPQEQRDDFALYNIYQLLTKYQLARPADLATCGKPVEASQEWQTALAYASSEMQAKMSKWLIHLPTMLSKLGLKNITYNEDKTEATLNACCCNPGITTLALPEGVVGISTDAFCDCPTLRTLKLPKSLRTIAHGVIDCTFPSFVVEMYDNTPLDDNPFVNPTVDSIKLLPSENPTLSIKEDLLLQDTGSGAMAVIACLSHKTKLIVPAGVTEIRSNAFSTVDPKSPVSIVLPNTVVKINSGAFSNSPRLKTIQLGDKLSIIGASAFANCTGLSEIRLPNTVTRLDGSAFSGCTMLTKAILSSKLTSISPFTFSGCTALAHVEIPDTVADISQSAFQNCSALTRLHLPASLSSIGRAAFNGCVNLTDLSVPKAVSSLPDSVFMNCKALKSITFAGPLTNIASNVFNGCSSLTNLQFSEGLLEIGSNAFANCTVMQKITLPRSVRTISNDCLRGCTVGKLIVYSPRNSAAEKWVIEHALGFAPPVSRSFGGILTRLLILLPLRILFHALLALIPLAIALYLLMEQSPIREALNVYHLTTQSGDSIFKGIPAAVSYFWNQGLMPVYKNPTNATKDIVIIAVSVVVAILLVLYLISCIRFIFKKKRRKYNPYAASPTNTTTY